MLSNASIRELPIYRTLLRGGMKPRHARRLIARAIASPKSHVFLTASSPASFCIWANTPDAQLWSQLSYAE